ncbi:aminotransferase class IV [Balneolaceae bacterium ANBcel3]|nr:aminotransferase class IV [Balneolaceae bacterium ANBcel3]
MSTGLDVQYIDGAMRPVSQGGERSWDRLSMYGEGCFDTLRAYQGGLLMADKHLERIHRGLKHINIAVPGELSSTELFYELLKEFLQINKVQNEDVRIRIQVWADDRTVGYHHHKNRKPRMRVEGSILNEEYVMDPQQPWKLRTSTVRKIPSQALPSDVKWTNGINYILAAAEAADHRADDALMLDVRNNISETTLANVFWKKGETIYTPSEKCDLLPGITRALVIKGLQEDGFKVETGEYFRENLVASDFVWLTNSVRELIPVCQLDDESIPFDLNFWDILSTRFQQTRNSLLHHVDI